MPVMHSLTPIRVASLRGHTAVITPEGTLVPDELVPVAQQCGCAVKTEVEPTPPAPLTDDGLTLSRAEEVKEAIKQVIEKNDPKDFTQGGLPRTAAVKQVMKGPVTNEEIIEALHALGVQ